MSLSEDADAPIEDEQSTPEYPPGTPGYSGSEEDGAAAAPPVESARPEPWWKRAGYSSLQEYLGEQNRLKALYESPPGAPVPQPHMPGREVADVGPAPVIENRVRQVNVKLRPSEGEQLDTAAKIYGLAPSTLARALVNRGVRAILEANGFEPG